MSIYLHIVILIILSFTADCGAGPHVVYKSTGENTHLSLKQHRTITNVSWRKDFNLIAKAENQNTHTRHPEKFHIHASDRSLYILNLTVDDSGYYQAETGQWEEIIIKYNLIVQEAVSKPVIDTNLVHQSNSSSFCHILVKCSADGESVIYDCDNRHCMQTNLTSTRVNIIINYTANEGLECTASNSVSTKRTSITNICSEKQTAKSSNKTFIYSLILMITISNIAVFIVLIINTYVCSIRKKKQNDGARREVNTLYSELEVPLRAETLADRGAGRNATTVYDVSSAPQNLSMQKR